MKGKVYIIQILRRLTILSVHGHTSETMRVATRIDTPTLWRQATAWTIVVSCHFASGEHRIKSGKQYSERSKF
jgi:hypothetical protein